MTMKMMMLTSCTPRRASKWETWPAVLHSALRTASASSGRTTRGIIRVFHFLPFASHPECPSAGWRPPTRERVHPQRDLCQDRKLVELQVIYTSHWNIYKYIPFGTHSKRSYWIIKEFFPNSRPPTPPPCWDKFPKSPISLVHTLLSCRCLTRRAWNRSRKWGDDIAELPQRLSKRASSEEDHPSCKGQSHQHSFHRSSPLYLLWFCLKYFSKIFL